MNLCYIFYNHALRMITQNVAKVNKQLGMKLTQRQELFITYNISIRSKMPFK